MILVLADSADPWTTLVHRECISYRRRSLLDPSCTTLGQGAIQLAGGIGGFERTWKSGGRRQTILLSDLTGIFARLTLPPPLELEELSLQDRDYVIKETNAAWIAFLNALPCAVVNRPVPGGRPTILAGSSSSQLVQDHGFLLPPSLCTSSQADAIFQFSVWGQRGYLKPLGSLSRECSCRRMMVSNKSAVSWSSRRSQFKRSRVDSG